MPTRAPDDGPIDLVSSLDIALANKPRVSLSGLLRGAEQLRRLKQWCRSALASAHLTEVAALLVRRLDASDDDLRAVGLPVDLLRLFPGWRAGVRAGFHAPDLGLRPAPLGAGEPLGELRLHLAPSSESASLALILLRDLLKVTDPTVSFSVVVQPGANIDGLQRLVGSFDADASSRVRFVEGVTSTIFSQDNALPALRHDGESVLLLPREFLRGTTRAEDELTLEAAESMFGVPVVTSRLNWQGGNLVGDGERYFVGVDTVGENMARFGLSSEEVLEVLAADLGAPVTPLGDLSAVRFDPGTGTVVTSGQAEYHLDLDLALLGRFGRKRKPRALVSDPALGIELLPRVLARRALVTGHFVPPAEARELIEAEVLGFAVKRHPRLLEYAATLEGLGYRVVGLPDVRVEASENLFATVNLSFGYGNVLPGLHRGRPAVYYLPFGLTDLDRAAVECYRKAGVTPVAVTRHARVANGLMMLRAGLRCFCGRVRCPGRGRRDDRRGTPLPDEVHLDRRGWA
jgi:hypothetical protein